MPKRIDQLKVWVAVYNSKKGNTPFILSQDAIQISLNSAWLAGFTDAEGCFNVHITKRPAQKIGFRTKLILYQKSFNGKIRKNSPKNV